MHSVRTAAPRISAERYLLSATAARREIPVTLSARRTLLRARGDISAILNGEDDRLVAVVGPCSIHDPVAAIDYAHRLSTLAEEVSDELLVVMRVYVEKPRTRLGWKGLATDPRLDGSYDLNHGLRVARSLMTQILQLGLPIACEFLDPALANYFDDVVAWGAIGARTVQSQTHRHMASGLAMPVGMKNATSGSVEDAIDSIVAASRGHVFPGIDDDGQVAIVATTGNPDCHVVLRGGQQGPNYGEVDVARALALLRRAGLPARVVVDASHGNSGKDHRRQCVVVDDLAERIGHGDYGIAGIMLESFLEDGRQELVIGQAQDLAYGVSITDECAGWDATTAMIHRLREAVGERRSALPTALAS